jgi:hypothetical protein
MDTPSLQTKPSALAHVMSWAIMATFLVMAAIGCWHAWSPVPIGDMWNGTLGFFVRAQGGDWWAWWDQHNEHRILLARIFFWMDMAWFQGKGWFLLLVNYLLMVGIGLSFLGIWRERTGGRLPLASAFLFAWVCSWIQYDNLTWGFQSQFLLAQWLPLLAFYFMHRSSRASDAGALMPNGWFWASAVCGVLSLGTMANGVIALPLLAVFALLLHRIWWQPVLLAVLAAAGVWIYFHGYTAPGGHGSLTQALRDNPSGLIEYMLAYLGGPFYYFLGKGEASLKLAQAAAIGMIAWSLWMAIGSIRTPRQSSLRLAMLCFILYIGGTAVATAGGRLIFGIEQGLTSRYMTPALMVWVAFLIATVPSPFPALSSKTRLAWAVPIMLMLLPMLHFQRKALTPMEETLYERDIGALAIELRIPDQKRIEAVFPNAAWALKIAQWPSEHNLSLFGIEPWRDLYEQLGEPCTDCRETTSKPATEKRCQGYIDELVPLSEDSRYLWARGWAFDRKNPQTGRAGRWTLADGEGLVRGFVLDGMARPDVAQAIDPRGSLAGFSGYVLRQPSGTHLRVQGSAQDCWFDVELPAVQHP